MASITSRTDLLEQDIKFTVNLDNMQQTIKNWNKLKGAFRRGIELGYRELADRTVEKLKSNMAKYGLEDSLINGTITVKHLEKGFTIDVGSEYAMYVEYGTGITGAWNPHPSPKTAWQYDAGGNGYKGWWYPTDARDSNPTKKLTSDGQFVAWTKGQKSRPFMYETYLWSSRSAHPIIRKNVTREVKKAGGSFK